MTNNTQKNWEDRTKLLPKELMELNQWVCHCKKVPINARTGEYAKSNDNTTWSSYKDACKFADNHKYDGIGYVITQESGIVGIDLDHCFLNEENSTTMQLVRHELFERVAQTKSYKEKSPSGTGLHVYIKGKWNGNANKVTFNEETGLRIEVYDNSHFFTVTGEKYYNSDEYGDELSDCLGLFANAPILEDQDLLDYIADYFAKHKSTASTKCNTINVTIESLDITKDEKEQLNAAICENSYFVNLWNGERPKGNESSDDMSLLYHLAKVFDDEATIKKLFLASPHARTKDAKHLKKLERKDYLDNSLAKAIELAGTRDEEPQTLHLLSFPNNDKGNGERFLSLFREQVRYCLEHDQWYRYDGVYWKPQLVAEMKYCCDDLSQTMDELSEWTCDGEHLKMIADIGNEATMNNMLKAASRKVRVMQDDLDKEAHLLVADNGVIDLRTGELMEHSHDLLITRKVNIDYNPNAPEPTRFLQFLDEICCGDEEIANYLLLSLGYAITGETYEQVMFIWSGDGSNGKGVLMDVLRNLFGDFSGSLAQDALTKKKEASSVNPTVASTLRKRMAFISEFNKNTQLDTALVKSLTGQDEVQVRELYKNHVTIKPTCKIIAATNFLPQIDWDDYAMGRRVVVIPFNAIFNGKKCDINLRQKLLDEKEGILKLLVEQAVRIYKEGIEQGKTLLREPAFMKRYLDADRRRANSVYCFVEDLLDVTGAETDFVAQEDLYDSYKRYCSEHCMFPETQTSFGKLLLKNCNVERKLYTAKRTVHYFGIKIKEETKDESVA